MKMRDIKGGAERERAQCLCVCVRVRTHACVGVPGAVARNQYGGTAYSGSG